MHLLLLITMSTRTVSYNPMSVDPEPPHWKAMSLVVFLRNLSHLHLHSTTCIPSLNHCTAGLIYVTYMNVTKCAQECPLFYSPTYLQEFHAFLLSCQFMFHQKPSTYGPWNTSHCVCSNSCLIRNVLSLERSFQTTMVSSLFRNRYSHPPYADLFFSIALVYYTLTCIFIPNLYPLQKKNIRQTICHARHCIARTQNGARLIVCANPLWKKRTKNKRRTK